MQIGITSCLTKEMTVFVVVRGVDMRNDSGMFRPWVTIIPHSNCTCERCRAGPFSSFWSAFLCVFVALQPVALGANRDLEYKKIGWSIFAWILFAAKSNKVDTNQNLRPCPYFHQVADFQGIANLPQTFPNVWPAFHPKPTNES